MTFEQIFQIDKDNLDRVLTSNEYERKHIERCNMLASMIEWERKNRNNEFYSMLGESGAALFDETLDEIKKLIIDSKAQELQNPSLLIQNIMFVHDLGKYDKSKDAFNGKDHEIRSAEIVLNKTELLKKALQWDEKNIDLLRVLALRHGLLGVTRTGEASILVLLPILESIHEYDEIRKRLILNLLIVLTCCDSGASGDFQTNSFYLDFSRIQLYRGVVENLLRATTQADFRSALFEEASSLRNTVKRVNLIVTSGKAHLKADAESIETSLQRVVDEAVFDLKIFASKRFDAGFFVFEPLLIALENQNTKLKLDTLYKFLKFIGVLSKLKPSHSIISLRNSFSMKEDVREQNQKNFETLAIAVKNGSANEIEETLRKHEHNF